MTIELDPSKVSPQTHQYIGMWRPPKDPAFHGVCCPQCTRHTVIGGCWHAGHYDVPQYRVFEHREDLSTPRNEMMTPTGRRDYAP